MQLLYDQLNTVSPETAEELYQKFYPACAIAKLTPTQAQDVFDRILALYAETDDPTLQSYCLLYFGAVVDTRALNPNTLEHLSHVLDKTLAALKDFRVKDSHGRYIHFLSHAAYLAQSIYDAGGTINWEALLEAYLRAEGPLVWHEDLVLADCLLGMVPKEDFASLLARLASGDSEGAKASNKRALWMAMKVINTQTRQHDDAAFTKLTSELMAVLA
ncbi:MAG TPA: hypothetical protein EYG79_05665 [Rhodobacteraceae bacterium]|nr:hypothetical protein [Paracoccaceae bacterium]